MKVNKKVFSLLMTLILTISFTITSFAQTSTNNQTIPDYNIEYTNQYANIAPLDYIRFNYIFLSSGPGDEIYINQGELAWNYPDRIVSINGYVRYQDSQGITSRDIPFSFNRIAEGMNPKSFTFTDWTHVKITSATGRTISGKTVKFTSHPFWTLTRNDEQIGWSR